MASAKSATSRPHVMILDLMGQKLLRGAGKGTTTALRSAEQNRCHGNCYSGR